ncbi:N-acetylneuraminate synthase [Candidatus Methanophagaceae archaeon]|nr:N-acetylneuraminate synthase [Methanophagales archaeon]
MGYHFKKKLKIGDSVVGEGAPCFVVAEIGLNHNGDLGLAKRLIDAAVGCGADAVKFQKRSVDKILTKEALDAPYDTWYAYGKTYGEHRNALELSNEDFIELQDYSNSRKIIFFASPWDEESADFLETINLPVYKIASADLINLPLIEHVAKKRKPMIVSTGMSTLDEVKDAVDVISKYTDELILLHCVSTYPSDSEEINLRNMETLRKTFNCSVGYSGHERGIAVSEAAVALGACVVERHFTLDRTMKGPDHAASLEPPGLFKLVRDIKSIEKSIGTSEKRIQEREKSIRTKLAKSVVAAVDIPKGTVISRAMLTVKGPNTGLPPKYIYILPGKKAVNDIKVDSVITEEMIE